MPITEKDSEYLFSYLNSISRIPKKDCKELSLLFSEKYLFDKEYFLLAGERAKYVGLIISGGVREFFLNEKGDEFNKSFSFQNEMTGSYFDLLNQKESIANIQALMDTKLIIAPFDEILQFFDNNYHWQRLARVIAENLFLKKAQREYDFIALSAEERYRKFLKEYPSMANKIPQYHIASYLGITSVALSRIKKRIEIKSSTQISNEFINKSINH
jgi:CRP-like cAMP-binding protein